MTRGRLPQRVGSLGLNGGGAATAVPSPSVSSMDRLVELDYLQFTIAVASTKTASSTLDGPEYQ